MIIAQELYIVFLLGIIEGITEFFPISSTGHMILIGNLLSLDNNRVHFFLVIVQCGAILSVIFRFWEELCIIFGICYNKIFLAKDNTNYFCFWHIFWGIFPSIVLGYIFYGKIRINFDLRDIMQGLLAGGYLLLFTEYFISNSQYVVHTDKLSYLKAFCIGCFQCLAFWPGFSRAGATISAGLLLGMNRQEALKFSFFLAVPVIFGAMILDIFHIFYDIKLRDLPVFFVGFFTSFITALCSINYALQIVNTVSFLPFVLYRFCLAGIIYYLLNN